MEIWKDIKGFEGVYQISNLGNVKSLGRIVPQKRRLYKIREFIMKKLVNAHGYNYAKLRKDGKQYGFLVHRLVAQAFIPNIKNKTSINHINGIKTDNRVENLEWVTFLENNIHAIKNKLHLPKKEKYIKVAQIKDGEIINVFDSIYSAGRITNINHRNIHNVLNGLQHTAGGFEWKRI